jgi:hypothetical protein
MDVNAAQAFSQVFILLILVHVIHVLVKCSSLAGCPFLLMVSWFCLRSWCPAPQGRCRCGSERHRILDRPRSGSLFRTVPLCLCDPDVLVCGIRRMLYEDPYWDSDISDCTGLERTVLRPAMPCQHATDLWWTCWSMLELSSQKYGVHPSRGRTLPTEEVWPRKA